MAGDWIKVEKATARKPEVLRIASLLNVHPDHAFGLCFRFWCWCDDQLRDANARGVSESLVDSLVERVGFASALLEVGWLQARNGSLAVPNFDRHLSQSAKSRALTARRVAKSTAKKLASDTNGGSVSKALPREESFGSGGMLELPESLNREEFKKALSDWLVYKRERRESYKPRGIASMIDTADKRAKSHGLQAVIDAIGRAMANGWQGWDHPNAWTATKARQGPGQTYDPEAGKKDPNYGRM